MTHQEGGGMSHRLQQLYDLEINFQIKTFWDGGFDWDLGYQANGWKDHGNADTATEAIDQLLAAAQKHFAPAFADQAPSRGE